MADSLAHLKYIWITLIMTETSPSI